MTAKKSWDIKPLVVSFCDDELANAFSWISDIQERERWRSEPIRLKFTEGDELPKDENCQICLFVDKKTGKAILVREWYREKCMKFNLLLNLDEVKEEAPVSYNRLLYNGLVMYKTNTYNNYRAIKNPH